MSKNWMYKHEESEKRKREKESKQRQQIVDILKKHNKDLDNLKKEELTIEEFEIVKNYIKNIFKVSMIHYPNLNI
jgi:hypothetical protein